MKAKKTAKKSKRVKGSFIKKSFVNNLKASWNWVSSKVDSVSNWLNKRKDKAESLGLVLLGLALLCPSVDSWTVVGMLVLAVGLLRSLSAWK